MSKPVTLATCIAKMYEGGRLDNSRTPGPAPGVKKTPSTVQSTLSGVEVRLNALETKVEQIVSSQAEVLHRMDSLSQGMGALEREVVRLGQEKASGLWGGEAGMLAEVRALCGETAALLRNLQQEGQRQWEKIEGIEQSVSTADKVLAYMADIFRSSRIVEFILKGSVLWTGNSEEKKDKSEEKTTKPDVSFRDKGARVEVESSRSVKDASETSVLRERVRSANSSSDAGPPGRSKHLEFHQSDPVPLGTQSSDGEAKATRRPKEVTLKSREPTRTQTFEKGTGENGVGTEGPGSDAVEDAEGEDIGVSTAARPADMETQKVVPTARESSDANQTSILDIQEREAGEMKASRSPEASEPQIPSSPACQEKQDVPVSLAAHSTQPKEGDHSPVKPQDPSITGTRPRSESGTKSSSKLEPSSKPEIEVSLMSCQSVTQKQTSAVPIQPEGPENSGVTEKQSSAARLVKKSPDTQLLIVDDCPPKPAPFQHRIVSAKQAPIGSHYAVKPNEVLGGGRFGQVHKCAELSSGLTLAAKIIKVKGIKERDEVKNEIGVMNQLNHVNLIQLYDAFESRTNLTLIMEYVEGGELFDRIVDESYHMTELDAIVFCRQICEGVQYLHQQYILHLDLKPENILCVSTTGNQIKIIDFGLARKYRPREKLKVNFGTPEFLAPEVVNYDFVSFPTDMWSVGVITYMLLSGLSPFLGENDTETMNNILHSNWDFDAEAFENVSEEAKDFISQLLIPEKCSRMSASGCVKHSWLNNLEEKAKNQRVRLKSHLYLQRYLAAHRQWKKHFYAVAAANRLKRLRNSRSTNPA